MNNTDAIKRGSSSLLILFIVFIFVLCSFFLILYGAHVYTNIRDQVDADFTRRMSISYITNKLRAYDVIGGVTIETDGAALLLCSEPEDPQAIFTYIYYYDGCIMEYITQEHALFDPGEGELIMEVDSFTVIQISGGLEINVGFDNEVIKYTVALKC